jgi:hypothetical protein
MEAKIEAESKKFEVLRENMETQVDAPVSQMVA